MPSLIANAAHRGANVKCYFHNRSYALPHYQSGPGATLTLPLMCKGTPHEGQGCGPRRSSELQIFMPFKAGALLPGYPHRGRRPLTCTICHQKPQGHQSYNESQSQQIAVENDCQSVINGRTDILL